MSQTRDLEPSQATEFRVTHDHRNAPPSQRSFGTPFPTSGRPFSLTSGNRIYRSKCRRMRAKRSRPRPRGGLAALRRAWRLRLWVGVVRPRRLSSYPPTPCKTDAPNWYSLIVVARSAGGLAKPDAPDLLKVRMQTAVGEKPTYTGTIRNIVKQDGPRGMFAGLSARFEPPLLRSLPDLTARHHPVCSGKLPTPQLVLQFTIL